MEHESKVIPISKLSEKDFDSDPYLPVKNYLDQNYDLKVNGITERLIWKKKEDKEYQVMTDRQKNSIYIELKKHGKKISFEDLSKLLFSDFIKITNPLKDYITHQAEKYDGGEYIEKISNTLEVDNSRNLCKWFKKWFVAMIANVFDQSKNTNHTCFVLSGEQGIFKTTWLSKLIPDELSEYLYVGQIKPENKDTIKQLALRLLVIIDDQLHKINKNNQDDLKHLITLHPVTYRGLFKQFDYDYPRLASFCGSVNGKEFLNDLTGSRRFLSFHALSIDMETMNKIDIGKAYGQAYTLYKAGFQYWFDQEDNKLINEENEQFTIVTLEQELIEKYFNLEFTATEAYNSTEIKLILDNFTKERISAKKIGEIMNRKNIKPVNFTDSDGKRRMRYPISYISPTQRELS